MSGCIFCKIIKGEIPSHKLYEDEEAYAFADIDPKAPTHILIIPKRHIATVDDATGEDQALLGRLNLIAVQLAKEVGIAESGYRLVINHGADGGQAVSHIHLHLLGGRQMNWPPG